MAAYPYQYLARPVLNSEGECAESLLVFQNQTQLSVRLCVYPSACCPYARLHGLAGAASGSSNLVAQSMQAGLAGLRRVWRFINTPVGTPSALTHAILVIRENCRTT